MRIVDVNHSQNRRNNGWTIQCVWCGGRIEPNSPRMRVFTSQGSVNQGATLAHLHEDCGSKLLIFCKLRLRKAKENTGDSGS